MSAMMWGWLIYLLGAVGVLAMLWWITVPFYTVLKVPLRFIAVAILLLPWSVSPDHAELAPAWVVVMFDGFAQQDMSWQRAGVPMLAMLLLAAVLSVLEILRLQRQAHD